MKKRIVAFLTIVLAITFYTSCGKTTLEKDCGGTAPVYSDIKGILETKCNTSGCHDANSENGDFTNYTGIKRIAITGNFRIRVLIQKNMPPAGELSESNLQQLQCWADNGYLEEKDTTSSNP